MAAHERYDYAGDARWTEFMRTVDLIDPAALPRLKLRFYQRYVDTAYVPPSAKQEPKPDAPRPSQRDAPQARPQPAASRPASGALPQPTVSAPPRGVPDVLKRTWSNAVIGCLVAGVVFALTALVGLSFGSSLYTVAILSSALFNGLSAYAAAQPFEASVYFLQRLFSQPAMGACMLSFVLLSAQSSILLVLAPLLHTVLVLLATPPPELPPPLHAQIAALRANVPQLGMAQAFAECLAFCLLLGRLFTPHGSILTLLSYGQALRLRSATSPSLQFFFRHIRLTVDSLLQHPSCPSAVRSVWQRLCSLLRPVAPQQ